MIGTHAYKFLLRHRVFIRWKSACGSTEVRRPKSKSWKSFNWRVVFETITYTRVHGLRCWGKYFLWLCGLMASRSMLRLALPFAFSRSFWVRVDDSHLIFLGSVGPCCEKNWYKASLSLHIQTSLCVCSTVK